jgi:DNA-binding beta-propeller fold protein YncE
MFDGGNNGAVVVPYSVDYSSLLYFINHDSSLGPVAEPKMPLNSTPLTTEEYMTIRNWVANGAPDKDGNIPFASSPDTRQKIYAIHQGCDMMAVIDAEKHVVMRYIPIGEYALPESPTYVHVSPNDGRYAYVSFWYNSKVRKIDTYTDQVVSSFDLGELFWNVLHMSKDGQKMLVTNGDNYNMLLIDPINWQFQTLTLNNEFLNPHGIASNATFDTFYVTGMFGNIVYKFAPGYNKKITIDNLPAASTSSASSPDPYQVIMSPDYTRYFISCANTNEVRVMDARTDSLVKVVPVGQQPQVMAVSGTQPYLVVTCTGDTTSPGMKGSVYVINYNTLELVRKIEGKFFQPHGISINDRNNTLYVFNRNQNVNGPAPHHMGPCSGRNGYYNVYNLKTLEPVSGKRYEVLVDPFISDVRFK